MKGDLRTARPRSIDETLQLARQHSPDPFPDVPPTAPADADWFYADGEYEAGALSFLVSRSDAVAKHSEYAVNFRKPRPRLGIELRLVAGRREACLRVPDGGEVRGVGETSVSVTNRGVTVENAAGGPLRFWVTAAGDEPATFALPDSEGEWETSLEIGSGEAPRPLRPRRGGTIPPHRASEPVVEIPLVRVNGLLASSAEVLARPVLRSAHQPVIATGESRDEATLARGVDQENDHEVVALGGERWSTRHPVAMRYVEVDGGAPAEASALAHIHPVASRGAFVCSDERLSRIWGVSAYTLRLCMQVLMVDGLKRDRMPWVGDQAISALANAFAFGDSRIARDSHLALGRPANGYVNGISDYSLWWVITARLLQEYFPVIGDPLPAEVGRFMENLLSQVDDRGLLRPTATQDGFTAPNAGSVLIDWGYELPEDATSAALQILWVWALEAASSVATGDIAARALHARDRALATLREGAWDATAGAWRAHVDGTASPDAYANFLAVAAGISDPTGEPGVIAAFRDSRGRTPYMRTVLLQSMLSGGEVDGVLDRIRREWGEMLDFDSTTFWEEFPSGDESPWSMYGRPFARSLCHAWGAGPAALLPEAVFGLKVLEPGWRRFSIHPTGAELQWSAAVIPSPLGPIGLRLEGSTLELDLPAGCTAIVGAREMSGPGSFVLEAVPA